MNVSRRKLAKMFTTAALAQQATMAQAPTAAPAKPSADRELIQAKTNLRMNAEQIAAVKLPRSAEPAFRFKA